MSVNLNPVGTGEAYLIPYQSYVVLFNQIGTSDPSITMLENTLGQNVTWTRIGVGVYHGTFDVPIPRTKIFMDNGTDYNGNGTLIIPISDNSSIIGYYMFHQDGNDNVNRMQIRVYNSAFVSTEYSTLLDTTLIPLQFKVYP
jgi:hypothetical protein